MTSDSRITSNAATQPMTGRRFAHNFDWNLFKTFFDIVEANGVSKAAQASSRKQPAVSMALKRLEDHVGMKLCQRGPSGFALTHEGEVLASVCNDLYDTVRSVPQRLANISEEVRGRVRIQLISNLIDASIDRAIGSFHRKHQQAEIFVSVSTWDEIRRSVLRNDVELGIAPAHHRDHQLSYDLLFTEVYRPYCGRTHALFGQEVDDARELAVQGIILTGADEPDELTRFRVRHNIGRVVAGLSEQLEEAKRLTALGLGICFLPESFAAPEVRDGTLHPVLNSRGAPASQIYLIWNPEAPSHRARDILLDHFMRHTPGKRS